MTGWWLRRASLACHLPLDVRRADSTSLTSNSVLGSLDNKKNVLDLVAEQVEEGSTRSVRKGSGQALRLDKRADTIWQAPT